jgi:hypothetical protein
MKLENLYPIIADHNGISDYQLKDFLIQVGNVLEDRLEIQMDTLDESQAKLILTETEKWADKHRLSYLQTTALLMAMCVQLGAQAQKLEEDHKSNS